MTTLRIAGGRVVDPAHGVDEVRDIWIVGGRVVAPPDDPGAKADRTIDARGFVVMPGGVGTMDEMFEALTLIQTRKILEFPVVLMGVEYWQPLLDLLKRMVDAATISAEDLNLVKVTDSIDEAMAHIQEHAIKKFGLRPASKPSRLLGELPRTSLPNN